MNTSEITPADRVVGYLDAHPGHVFLSGLLALSVFILPLIG